MVSFSWEYAIKITKSELKYLTDVNMILDCENGISAEIAKAIFHYDKANNKYMLDYVETKESRHIQYLDFNNQYGCTLLSPIPYDKFSDFDYILMFDVNYLECLQA